jgi:hypothetical protein
MDALSISKKSFNFTVPSIRELENNPKLETISKFTKILKKFIEDFEKDFLRLKINFDNFPNIAKEEIFNIDPEKVEENKKLQEECLVYYEEFTKSSKSLINSAPLDDFKTHVSNIKEKLSYLSCLTTNVDKVKILKTEINLVHSKIEEIESVKSNRQEEIEKLEREISLLKNELSIIPYSTWDQWNNSKLGRLIKYYNDKIGWVECVDYYIKSNLKNSLDNFLSLFTKTYIFENIHGKYTIGKSPFYEFENTKKLIISKSDVYKNYRQNIVNQSERSIAYLENKMRNCASYMYNGYAIALKEEKESYRDKLNDWNNRYDVINNLSVQFNNLDSCDLIPYPEKETDLVRSLKLKITNLELKRNSLISQNNEYDDSLKTVIKSRQEKQHGKQVEIQKYEDNQIIINNNLGTSSTNSSLNLLNDLSNFISFYDKCESEILLIVNDVKKASNYAQCKFINLHKSLFEALIVKVNIRKIKEEILDYLHNLKHENLASTIILKEKSILIKSSCLISFIKKIRPESFNEYKTSDIKFMKFLIDFGNFLNKET